MTLDLNIHQMAVSETSLIKLAVILGVYTCVCVRVRVRACYISVHGFIELWHHSYRSVLQPR